MMKAAASGAAVLQFLREEEVSPDWPAATIGVILASARDLGATFRLVDGEVRIAGEEHLPPALAAEIRQRPRGLLYSLTYKAGGDEALAALLAGEQAEELVLPLAPESRRSGTS